VYKKHTPTSPLGRKPNAETPPGGSMKWYWRRLAVFLFTALILGVSIYFLENAGSCLKKPEEKPVSSPPKERVEDKSSKIIEWRKEDHSIVLPVKRVRKIKFFGSKRTLAEKAGGDGVLYGRVREKDTDNSIEGATARLSWRYDAWDADYAAIETSTSGNGKFRVAGITWASWCYFQVEKEGFAAWYKVVSFKGEKHALSLGDIRLEKGTPVTIKVKDSITGTPLPDATIYSFRKSGTGWACKGRFVGGSDGSRSFGLIPGSYYFWIEAKRHPPIKEFVTIENEAVVLNIALDRGGRIAGKVVDENNNPVAGARAYISSNGHALGTRTDDEGMFELVGCFFEKKYNLSISAEGYMGNGISNLKADVDGLLVRLPNVLTINGSVTDADTGEPVQHATVSFKSNNRNLGHARTDQNGAFKHSLGRNVSTATLLASCKSYNSSKEMKIEIPENGQNFPAVELTLERGITISGCVKAQGTGKPVKGVGITVDFESSNYSTQTGEDGTYIIGGLKTGTAKVYFKHVDYTLHMVDRVKITKSGATLDALLSSGGRIAGTVTDESGKALQGITVAAVCTDCEDHGGRYKNYSRLRAKTDEHGKYQLNNANPEKTYRVIAGSSTFIPAEKKVIVRAEIPSPVDFVLRKGGEITGHVYDGAGKPLCNANVYYQVVRVSGETPGGNTQSSPQAMGERREKAGISSRTYVYSQKDGSFSFTGLLYGDYKLTVSRSQYIQENREISIGAGGPTEMEIILRKGGIISGKLLSPDGKPVQNTYIRLEEVVDSDNSRNRHSHRRRHRHNSRSYSSHCQKDGSYKITGIQPGQYRIRIQANGYRKLEHGPISVGLDTEFKNIDLVLDAGLSVSGTVTDEKGEPVHGAQIYANQNGGRSNATTNDRGKFVVTGLVPGKVTVSVNRAGYNQHNSRVEAEAGDRNISLSLKRCGKVTFILEGYSAGNGHQYVHVYARRTDSGNNTYSRSTHINDGKFDIFLQPGSYDLTIKGRNIVKTEIRNVDVAAGETTSLSVPVNQGGRIIATVLSENERNPVKRAYIEVYKIVPNSGSNFSYRLSHITAIRAYDNGQAVAAGLESGSYYLRVHQGNYAMTVEENISVMEGSATKITVLLNKGGKLSGYVRDANGQPVRSAHISVKLEYAQGTFNYNLYSNSTYTSSSGRYEFKRLPSGRYTLKLQLRDANGSYHHYHTRTVEITSDGQVSCDLQI